MTYLFATLGALAVFMLYSIAVSLGIIAEALLEKEK